MGAVGIGVPLITAESATTGATKFLHPYVTGYLFANDMCILSVTGAGGFAFSNFLSSLPFLPCDNGFKVTINIFEGGEVQIVDTLLCQEAATSGFVVADTTSICSILDSVA